MGIFRKPKYRMPEINNGKVVSLKGCYVEKDFKKVQEFIAKGGFEAVPIMQNSDGEEKFSFVIVKAEDNREKIENLIQSGKRGEVVRPSNSMDRYRVDGIDYRNVGNYSVGQGNRNQYNGER